MNRRKELWSGTRIWPKSKEGTDSQRLFHLFERMLVATACLVWRKERMWQRIESGKLLILSAIRRKKAWEQWKRNFGKERRNLRRIDKNQQKKKPVHYYRSPYPLHLLRNLILVLNCLRNILFIHIKSFIIKIIIL